MRRPPGTLRVLRLLAWTSVLRLLRAATIRRGKRNNPAGARTATARKRGNGLLVLMVVLLPFFAFQSFLMTSQAVRGLSTAAQTEPSDEARPGPRPGGRFDDDADFASLMLADEVRWPTPAAQRTFVGCSTMLLVALLAMLLAISFGGANASLAGGDWTQAWMMTFPVPTRSLVLARALEYSLVQLFPWLTLFPLSVQMLSTLGAQHAFAIAALATLMTTVLTGSLRLLLETWLRVRFSLRTLRSIQGLATLTALVLLGLVFTVCLTERPPAWFLRLGAGVPPWLKSLPAAWPLAFAQHGWLLAAPGMLATVVAFVLGCSLTIRLLSRGVMRSGGVDPGVRGAARSQNRGRMRLGIVGKDLAMLLRDRNFLVQTLVVPIFIIGMQLVVNPGLGRGNGISLPLVAYGIGMYAIIGGCFQVLSAEGRSLWILFTLPVPIGDMVLKKVRIWAATGITFAAGSLLVFASRAPSIAPLQFASDMLFVVVGVWCAAHIAAGISILGCNPTEDYVPRQPKVRHVYLYFFFAASYGAGLQGGLPQRIAALLVFATLAFAVWQRAAARLPWLLDPVDDAAPRITVFDGAASVLVFFVLQALTSVVLGVVDKGASLSQLLFVSFAASGAITVLLFVTMLWLRGIDVPRELALVGESQRHRFRSLALGAAAGLGLGGLALGYAWFARRYEWFGPLPPTPDGMLLVTVVAAPPIEEILFRGLLLRGLLRSVSIPLAVVWSAALFAAVHPMPSWPPVFGLGLATAMVLLRTGFLPAAMATHAAYNLIVLTFGY